MKYIYHISPETTLDAVSEYETLEQRMLEIYVEDLSTCYNNAGIAYEENREFEKTEHYYLLSIDLLTKYLNKRIDFAYTLSVSLGKLGMLYEENQESKKALDYYQKAVQVIKNVELEGIGPDSYVSQLIGLYRWLIGVCPKAGKASLVSMYKKELEKLNKT